MVKKEELCKFNFLKRCLVALCYFVIHLTVLNMGQFRKIINDPVYGFITIDDELINEIISHPFFQRLRRINQMAMAHLVYPGAVHSRLRHAFDA